MPTFRKRLLTDEWVIIAPERARRPKRIEATTAANDGPCPFCPAFAPLTPEPISDWDSPQFSGAEWGIRAVPNKFPALRVEADDTPASSADGLYQSRGGLGAHEVIIEAPRHIESWGDMAADHLACVLSAWRDRLHDLSGDRRLKAAMVFKNSGAAAGASIEHVHSQLVAFPMVPSRMQRRLHTAHDYHERTGHCPLCKMLHIERTSGDRLVLENDEVAVVAPFASRVPFELWILPSGHATGFRFAGDSTLVKVAELLVELLPKWIASCGGVDHNLVLHTGPFDLGDEPYYHWHLELIPRTGQIAGLEWGSDVFVNATASEVAADHLRNLLN